MFDNIDVQYWVGAFEEDIDSLGTGLAKLIDGAKDRSSQLAGDADSRALQVIAVAVLAVVVPVLLALFLARRITRPLRRLTAAAAQIREDLPKMVEQMATPGEGPELTIPEIPVNSNDEVGRLAKAFNDVNKTTVATAQEQAALRGSIAAMFVNVARRDQVLLSRQLSFLDQLERTEENPETLDNLFKLDHLATRMRRNAESLLVLAGIDTGRRLRRPMPLADVVRTASSEIEHYERVDLAQHVDPPMVGHAALIAAHMLAELLENATAFSDPGSRVLVTTDNGPIGVRLTITDEGLGMSCRGARRGQRPDPEPARVRGRRRPAPRLLRGRPPGPSPRGVGHARPRRRPRHDRRPSTCRPRCSAPAASRTRPPRRSRPPRRPRSGRHPPTASRPSAPTPWPTRPRPSPRRPPAVDHQTLQPRIVPSGPAARWQPAAAQHLAAQARASGDAGRDPRALVTPPVHRRRPTPRPCRPGPRPPPVAAPDPVVPAQRREPSEARPGLFTGFRARRAEAVGRSVTPEDLEAGTPGDEVEVARVELDTTPVLEQTAAWTSPSCSTSRSCWTSRSCSTSREPVVVAGPWSSPSRSRSPRPSPSPRPSRSPRRSPTRRPGRSTDVAARRTS